MNLKEKANGLLERYQKAVINAKRAIGDTLSMTEANTLIGEMTRISIYRTATSIPEILVEDYLSLEYRRTLENLPMSTTMEEIEAILEEMGVEEYSVSIDEEYSDDACTCCQSPDLEYWRIYSTMQIGNRMLALSARARKDAEEYKAD